MVYFKGLIDAVSTLETGINTLTKELETVKSELERVKTEYHNETNPNTGMREFILEKVKTWKEIKEEGGEREGVWGYAWENRDVDAWKNGWIRAEARGLSTLFSWETADEATNQIQSMCDITKRKVDGKSVILVCGIHDSRDQIFFCEDKMVFLSDDRVKYLDYKDITDLEKKHSSSYSWINIGTSEENTSIEIRVGRISSDRHERVIAVLYTFLWDIYEFVNG